MAKDHFTTLIEKAQADCGTAMLGLPLGESLRHAELKGKYQGLTAALELYRQSIKIDATGDVDHDRDQPDEAA